MLNTIYNESGAFSVDGHGVLRKFECGEKTICAYPTRRTANTCWRYTFRKESG